MTAKVTPFNGVASDVPVAGSLWERVSEPYPYAYEVSYLAPWLIGTRVWEGTAALSIDQARALVKRLSGKGIKGLRIDTI